MVRRMDRNSKRRPTANVICTMVGLAFAIVVVGVHMASPITRTQSPHEEHEHQLPPSPRRLKGPPIKVFTAFSNHAIAQKERRDLSTASDVVFDHQALSPEEQFEFLKKSSPSCGIDVESKYEQLVSSNQSHLAQELWKYCALYQNGGVYVDAESPLLVSLETLLLEYPQNNIAVFADASAYPKTLHGSLLVLREPQSPVVKGMLTLLIDTPVETLDSSPLLIPRTLHELVSKQVGGNSPLVSGSNANEWLLLDQRCSIDPHQKTNFNTIDGKQPRVAHTCPKESGYCCHVQDSKLGVVMMTRHPLLPYQVLPDPTNLPKPFNSIDFPSDDLPFIATVEERIMPKPSTRTPTPNFYDLLHKSDSLPSSKQCSSCLREKKGATCESCRKPCNRYCKALCHTEVKSKFVSKQLIVTPPRYARDPHRIIPRIIHQTWFEEVTAEAYPNMSRLIESWKSSGWEYKFFTDRDSKKFLRKHFPSEVLEAYESLIPGAFKADLFRYCVLLIYGGVYADMDVMLETNLDIAVGPDVGFMVPSDEPGKQMDRRMCLWNGFIAAAPGHPYLAKVIETVVNGIRNRFTSVDVDQTFCPDPELSILHAFDTLFTAGPCALGGTVNKVLGRHGQTQYEPGELDPWSSTESAKDAEMGTSFVEGLSDNPKLRIPGRTVILKQNKWDMGAHRFTLLEKNMVVAATDMPEYDDRESLGEKTGDHKNEHYSKAHKKEGIYGVDMVYKNTRKANEDIRFLVNGQWNQYKKSW